MAAAPQISAGAVANLAKLLIGGGLTVYGAANSIFNVEGGHRAIVFNRLIGIKETVSLHDLARATTCKRIRGS
jgi:prohibitin 2